MNVIRSTVYTGEIDTVYQFLPLLAWRLMALRDFSFYFLISNLVAVVLRFLEEVKKNITGNIKNMRHPFMYISLPPGIGANCTNFAERKLGQLPCFSYGTAKKGPVFF